MSKLFIERVVSMSWLPLMLSFVHTRTLISMLVSAVVRKTISFWRHWDIVVNAVAYLIKHLKCNTPADAIDYPRLLFPILWLMTCRFQLNSYPYTIFVFLSCFLSHFLASSFIISFSVCVSRSFVLSCLALCLSMRVLSWSVKSLVREHDLQTIYEVRPYHTNQLTSVQNVFRLIQFHFCSCMF